VEVIDDKTQDDATNCQVKNAVTGDNKVDEDDKKAEEKSDSSSGFGLSQAADDLDDATPVKETYCQNTNLEVPEVPALLHLWLS
jgi:hypothetical protein